MKKRTFIAEANLGECGLCLLTMDAGEFVTRHEDGRQVHTGCVSKVSKDPRLKPKELREIAQNAHSKARERYRRQNRIRKPVCVLIFS